MTREGDQLAHVDGQLTRRTKGQGQLVGIPSLSTLTGPRERGQLVHASKHGQLAESQTPSTRIGDQLAKNSLLAKSPHGQLADIGRSLGNSQLAQV
jgi:hypothetical protein